jgi:hypothetical protein
MVTPTDLNGIQHVDICTGGDHGAGRFRMLLKLLFRFSDKPSITRKYEIANVLHSNDDIGILNKTVLQKIIDSLRLIHDGGRFIVTLDDDKKIQLSFGRISENNKVICDVPVRLFVNGDMKYFAQMLGREGMSTSWCMWCKSHPSEWKGLFSLPNHELWTIEQQSQVVQRINSGQLKEPRDKKGIVSLPLMDFIEPNHYIFPQLHFEIGTVNNVLDALRGFIEEEVEVLSDSEKEARNAKIIADVSYDRLSKKVHISSSGHFSVNQTERLLV